MRYNEVNSEHLGELNIISNIQDDDSIFEVSLIVATDIQGNIRANYEDVYKRQIMYIASVTLCVDDI